jgi:hypothetical protein
MAKKPLPSPARLRQLLEYFPATGLLRWRPRQGADANRWNAKHAGRPAGCITPEGYIFLKIDNRSLAAHRVIWAMNFGAWPNCIDHKNGKRADNRLKNLRSVSRAINQRNQKLHRSNTSGVTGVTWNAARQVWIAQIGVLGSTIYLGSYDSREEAAISRKNAEKLHKFTGRV